MASIVRQDKAKQGTGQQAADMCSLIQSWNEKTQRNVDPDRAKQGVHELFVGHFVARAGMRPIVAGDKAPGQGSGNSHDGA